MQKYKNKNIHFFFLFTEIIVKIFTVKSVLRGHLSEKEKVIVSDNQPLKRGSIFMTFSMTEQEKGNLLIEVTAY